MYFPIFPSPLDEDGNPVCKYFPKEPDQEVQKYLNEAGGSYNELNDKIILPYKEVSDCVVVPYDYWLKILSYSAETEAAAKVYAAAKKK